MKSLLTTLFIAFSFLSCATAPQKLDRPVVHEFMLDPEAKMLMGTVEGEDLPLSFCETEICYVFSDADLIKIKRYIVELECRGGN